MKELINEEGRVVKCIEASTEFKKLLDKGFKIKEQEVKKKEEVVEEKQEEKKPVRKRRASKKNES